MFMLMATNCKLSHYTTEHSAVIRNLGMNLFKLFQFETLQDSIPVGCMPPAWKSYILQFQLPSLDITPGGRSSNEQVWTGLQWSPPDVTCRGGSQNEQVWAGLHWWPPEVTNGGRGPQVWCLGVPYLTFSWERWYPTMWPIPMMHLMLPSPSPQKTDAYENITFPQLRLGAVIKTNKIFLINQLIKNDWLQAEFGKGYFVVFCESPKNNNTNIPSNSTTLWRAKYFSCTAFITLYQKDGPLRSSEYFFAKCML